MGFLAPGAAVDPCGLQHLIHLRGGWTLSVVGSSPGNAKAIEVCAAALGARAMPGGERDGLVGEEQLRPAMGSHDLAVPALEAQHAGDPGVVFPPAPAELAMLVVQDAAVAHQRPAKRLRHDLTRRQDAVLACQSFEV